MLAPPNLHIPPEWTIHEVPPTAEIKSGDLYYGRRTPGMSLTDEEIKIFGVDMSPMATDKETLAKKIRETENAYIQIIRKRFSVHAS